MIRDIKELQGSSIVASDGRIGKVSDFYFDDQSWDVRYLIVDTGNWLLKHDVLVSPLKVTHTGVNEHTISVALSKNEIEHCPQIDLAAPVSPSLEGSMTGISGLQNSDFPSPLAIKPYERKDYHLHSWLELNNYQIRTQQGTFQKVTSLVIDDESWKIKALVLQNGSLLHRRRVMVSPAFVKSLSWPACILELEICAEGTPA